MQLRCTICILINNDYDEILAKDNRFRRQSFSWTHDAVDDEDSYSGSETLSSNNFKGLEELAQISTEGKEEEVKAVKGTPDNPSFNAETTTKTGTIVTDVTGSKPNGESLLQRIGEESKNVDIFDIVMDQFNNSMSKRRKKIRGAGPRWKSNHKETKEEDKISTGPPLRKSTYEEGTNVHT